MRCSADWRFFSTAICFALRAARRDGMLARLGKGNDAWALELSGVELMVMGERRMWGWVRVDESVFGDEGLRHKIIAAALAFVRVLPPK